MHADMGERFYNPSHQGSGTKHSTRHNETQQLARRTSMRIRTYQAWEFRNLQACYARILPTGWTMVALFANGVVERKLEDKYRR